MSQPPPGGGLSGGDAAQLGLASFNTFCAGAFAMGLLLQLDDIVALPWGGVFAPFLLGHATAAVAHALKRRAHGRATLDDVEGVRDCRGEGVRHRCYQARLRSSMDDIRFVAQVSARSSSIGRRQRRG